MKEIINATVVIKTAPIDKCPTMIKVTDFSKVNENTIGLIFDLEGKIVEYTTSSQNTTISNNKCFGMKNGGNDDLYFVLEDSFGNRIEFCVERYINYEEHSTTYESYVTKLNSLTIGDNVRVNGFMYWWNGPNPHVMTINKVV